jgi:predicted CXXCH cytochrome family protein
MLAAFTQTLAIAVALGAAGTALPEDRATPGGTCELSRVDRRSTPSQACMTCHDGSAGALIGFRMAADGRGMEHPVTVDYAAAAAAHPDHLRPASALPAEVPLVRGKVECTTCHDGASPDRKRVATVSDLCLACHRM